MARGRLVSRTLGSSRKYAALRTRAGKLGEFAQTLYPLLIACSDDFGRMAGDAFTVKLTVFPSSPRSEAEFATALLAMHAERLIHLYESNGVQVLALLEFKEHQPGLSKRTVSKFPEPPVNFTEIPLEEKGREEKGRELNRTALARVVDTFTAFWFAYPKKKSKSDAEKAWRKLAPSPELCQRIQDAIAAQRVMVDWTKDDGKYIPFPATWLNGRRWEDETSAPSVGPAVSTRTAALARASAEFLAGGKP